MKIRINISLCVIKHVLVHINQTLFVCFKWRTNNLVAFSTGQRFKIRNCYYIYWPWIILFFISTEQRYNTTREQTTSPGIKILTPYHSSMSPPTFIVSSCCDREIQRGSEHAEMLRRKRDQYTPPSTPGSSPRHHSSAPEEDLIVPSPLGSHHHHDHSDTGCCQQHPRPLSPSSPPLLLPAASRFSTTDNHHHLSPIHQHYFDRQQQSEESNARSTPIWRPTPSTATPFKTSMITMDDIKKHQCEYCHKWFQRSSSLSNHRLIHKNTKSFKCGQCNMCFLRKSDLGKHMVTHSGSKPYQCKVCGKRFSQSSNMLTHQRRHTGIRPYSCGVCGKAFYRKVDVRRHATVHKDYWLWLWRLFVRFFQIICQSIIFLPELK